MLTRLILTDFRNHADASIDVGGGFVVLSGDNGAGKTNVLEAVSLLAPGRGLRRAPLSDMVRQGGAGGFGVAATLAGDVRIGTGTQATAPERRIVRVNGATAPATALADWTSVLWLTPAMDRLFVEPASERRRFLDRLTLALAPGHAHHSARYDAAMRARNRLLGDDAPPDGEWLSALETAMAEHGAAIDAARAATVAQLAECTAIGSAGFGRAGLALASGSVPDLARALAEGRRRDAAAGRTLVGPHRDDLIVTHLDKQQAAALCSTGEQKVLLFGIVLAHAALVAERTDRAPILLLDEVAAHLDPSRRAALFAALAGLGQVWMTGTEAALFADLPGDATRLGVSGGTIAPGITPA
ncbi:DNA replication/repair protein RecF [Sphingomonas donggukensis]|uniref:DNA replication and repair protein RecF n=1 Tax=Sphingomonas donggukensis TaxID=2949093 RepID=A0ABY4TTF9_9SPHN|nr:DNA replication/repair protein RecF [Sphingomonas donggukensis]URW75686.1 DNA replication/repair protein RecF [Sphingomonas donggukensis]